jgi:hypothetical protein
MVDFTPQRPLVMPGPRRTPAIQGLPRARWILAYGPQDQQGEWCKPQSCPPWLAQEPFDALPSSRILREVRYQVRQRGLRSRPIPLVTTWLEAAC